MNDWERVVLHLVQAQEYRRQAEELMARAHMHCVMAKKIAIDAAGRGERSRHGASQVAQRARKFDSDPGALGAA